MPAPEAKVIKPVEDKPEVAVIKSTHEQWLQHPMTQAFIKVLKKDRERVVGSLSGSSMDETIPDQKIRFLALTLRELESIIGLISNSELLIFKLAK